MSRVDFGKFVKNRLASLVSFDNTGTDINGTEAQSAITQLAGRHFGKNFGIARSNPNFINTTTTFQDALVINIPNAPAGQYFMMWRWYQNNSKANTSGEVEARFNDLAVVTEVVNGSFLDNNGLGLLKVGFADFNILATPNLKVSIAIRLTIGNGQARVNTMNLVCYRVS